MSKKNKQKHQMQEFEDDVLVPYAEILAPFRKIIHEGYKLERKATSHFNYAGYNIGKQEKIYSPTPEERFSSRWLNNEAKFNRTLIDNVLLAIFQLGIEQGRKSQAKTIFNGQIAEDILKKKCVETLKLRAKLAEFEPSYAQKDVSECSETLDLNEFLLLDEQVDTADTKEEG